MNIGNVVAKLIVRTNNRESYKDSREVGKLLKKEGIRYNIGFSSNSEFPSFESIYLDIGVCRFYGIGEIKEFVGNLINKRYNYEGCFK